MQFLKNLFRRTPARQYEYEKNIAAGKDVSKKRKLAANSRANPEILFYLANDKDIQTRRAVASNIGTPIQASKILANDPDEDVRIHLTERLVKLLPELSDEMHGQLYAFTVKCLHTLAEDEVLRIRRSLSESLKDHAFAPPEVAKKLAMDTEREVSEPILRYCTKISDEDLLEIIQNHPSDWARMAVMSRDNMSADLADVLIDDISVKNGENFLRNSKCKINTSTMTRIIEKSRDYMSWQEPVALRPEMNYRLASQLAGFAGQATLDILTNRSDFDAETRAEIAHMVSRRSVFSTSPTQHETLEQKVNRYAAAGMLNYTTLADGLAWQEDGFVKLALARMAGVHQLIVDKIMNSGSPKSITALCWYTGLPMRLAVEMQKSLGKIAPQSLIYARAGVDYPVHEEDMIWQLEFFGIEVERIDENVSQADASATSHK